MTWTGKLAHLDLGAGVWVLETDDGDRIPLYGDVPAKLSGQRVKVDGQEVEVMGFAMVGDTAIQVKSVTASS